MATFVLLLSFVMIVALADTQGFVKAQTPEELQIIHGGSTDLTIPGMPILKPLPEGVTPDYTIDTTAYLSFTPNPIGVGQTLLVNMWTTPGMYHAFYANDYTVSIQFPNGSTITVGPFNSYLGDASAWFQLPVDAVGTWSFKLDYPGTYLPATNYTDRPGGFGSGIFGTPGNQYYLGASVWYKPSSTDWQNLTVQQDFVASWPDQPFPTGYWTRPIEPNNRNWANYIGNYPWSGVIYYPNGRVLYSSNYKYTAYVTAPNTGHIAWIRQGAMAGMVGEGFGSQAFTGTSTQPSIIFQGRAYETYTKPGTGTTAATYLRCYDIRTGDLYWEYPVQTTTTQGFFGPSVTPVAPTAISYEFGSIEVPGAEARAGFTATLVATTASTSTTSGRLLKFDPFTGAITTNVTGLPPNCTIQLSGGGGFFGGAGNFLYNDPYALAVQTIGSGANAQYRLINWTVAGTSNDFSSRVLNNITWPQSSLGTADFDAGIAVTASWATPPGGQWCIGYDILSIDLKTGEQLFHVTSNDTLTDNIQTPSSLVVNRGKIALAMQNLHWSFFDGRTGAKLYETQSTDYPWGLWWAYATASYDFNESKSAVIGTTYWGVYAFDWDNGDILWSFSAPSVPFEGPYGTDPFFAGVQIADGKVFCYNTEHTPTAPITRGWRVYALNATTGEEVWSCGTPGSIGAIADGYATVASYYDGSTYCYGPGQTTTTVTTPDTSVPIGTPVFIKGSVMDMSPAQPNTPAVSADTMKTQMEYLHLQAPIDGIWHNETITGVPVTLTAIDENDNVVDIGTATTNGYYGTFSMEWTPPHTGAYTVIASFAGDDSYGSSSAGAGLSVSTAGATPTPSGTGQPSGGASYNDIALLVIGATIAIIIVIIIVGLLIARRR
jgi:hypothetical protein